jgi:hypothetical protein
MVHSTPIPAKAQPPMATSRGRPISNETGRYPGNVPTAAHAAQPGLFVLIYYSNFVEYDSKYNLPYLR